MWCNNPSSADVQATHSVALPWLLLYTLACCILLHRELAVQTKEVQLKKKDSDLSKVEKVRG